MRHQRRQFERSSWPTSAGALRTRTKTANKPRRNHQNFSSLAGGIVVASSGVVLETRGDEVLASFDSPQGAVRAAMALQVASAGGALPVGIGLDAGKALAADGGYRGRALNMAARLCASFRTFTIGCCTKIQTSS